MKKYVQCNPDTGEINAVVYSCTAPIHDSQLEFPEDAQTNNKMVDLLTMELVDIPVIPE